MYFQKVLFNLMNPNKDIIKLYLYLSLYFKLNAVLFNFLKMKCFMVSTDCKCKYYICTLNIICTLNYKSRLLSII